MQSPAGQAKIEKNTLPLRQKNHNHEISHTYRRRHECRERHQDLPRQRRSLGKLPH